MAALLAASVASPVSAAEWGVEQLMREMAQVQSSRAKYVELKHMAILSEPLRSSGTLIYTAPGRLEKHMLAPRQESMLLESDRLTLENKARNQSRSFAIREYPVIGAFVEGIRSTLAGDLATLNRYYRVSLEGEPGRWRLTLKPVETAMEDFVSEIRIAGSGNRIDAIEILEPQGDRSVMTITRDAS